MGLAGSAAAAAATNRNTRKVNQAVQEASWSQTTLLAAIANELVAANQHAIALVNEQMRTNQLLEQLLAKGA